MMKIALCDDERKILDDVSLRIKKYAESRDCLELEVFGFDSVKSIEDALDEGKLFDVYILDVYIGDELGTTLAGKIRKRGIESPIIFLTTSIEHAPESFETNTLRYLVKPLDNSKFCEAMDAAILAAEKAGEKLIKLKTENGVESINASNIMCSESHDHYQYVTLFEGTQLKVRLTVAELFTILAKYGGFIRVGSPYIINLRHVKNVSRTEVLLYNNVSIQIPRGKHADIKNAFWDYQYEGGED